MKPTILTFVRYYLPGYKSGGPVRTIANLVDALGDTFDFRIVTADRDALESTPYADVAIDRWNTLGKARVFHASPRYRSVDAISRLVRDTPHDILYLNSCFDPRFTVRPLLARRLGRFSKRPVILAPRGEFSAGALRIRAWKKRPYLLLARGLGLYRDVTWQASSEHEAEDIRRAMGRCARRIVVASNLPASLPDVPHGAASQEQHDSGRLRVVFLSRVTPMKNLDFALRVLARVHVPLNLDIYGVIDDEPYWRECRRAIDRLPANITVAYHGPIPHEEVAPKLRNHDLFFLPTRGENYGHVIHEALAAGVPVLISDRTPWRDLDEQGVGFVRSLDDPPAFADAIEQFAALDGPARRAMRRRAADYARRRATDDAIVVQNLDLFLNLVQARQA